MIPGRVFRFFLEHCLHQAQTDGRGKPELRGVANCCLLCCLDCSTKYVQYISHNAYIYVAIHDLSFCDGAKQAFELTLRNIGQVSHHKHAAMYSLPLRALHILRRMLAPRLRRNCLHTRETAYGLMKTVACSPPDSLRSAGRSADCGRAASPDPREACRELHVHCRCCDSNEHAARRSVRGRCIRLVERA